MATVISNRIGSSSADAYLSKISFVMRDNSLTSENNFIQAQYTLESENSVIDGSAHGNLDSSYYSLYFDVDEEALLYNPFLTFKDSE